MSRSYDGDYTEMRSAMLFKSRSLAFRFIQPRTGNRSEARAIGFHFELKRDAEVVFKLRLSLRPGRSAQASLHPLLVVVFPTLPFRRLPPASFSTV